MYFIAIIVVMIAFSMVLMAPMMAKSKEKNSIVFAGMISSWIGVLLLFALSSINGNTIAELINNQIAEAIKVIIQDENLLKILNLDGLSESTIEQRLFNMYHVVAVLLPSIIIMAGAIISVICYKIIWHIAFKGRNKSVTNFYIREYCLSNRSLLMWAVMNIISYLLAKDHIKEFSVLAINFEIVIRNMLKLEGILSIFFLGKMRGIHWILMVLFIGGILLIPYGDGILIGVGLYSTIFSLRRNQKFTGFKKR